jgi:nucleoside-diphosphate-sugar epimerase
MTNAVTGMTNAVTGMTIAVTGGTGFVGRYIIDRLTGAGHRVRAWYRPSSDREGFNRPELIDWLPGSLDDLDSCAALVADTRALVHAAFWRPRPGFRGAEGDLVKFVSANVVGSIRLFEAARAAGIRTVFVSTCAVHEKILDDRPLDETHPIWPKSHYGAHKGALEQFVHSYGLGHGDAICSLRPCGVYGVARPIESSRWFDLLRAVAAGRPVTCQGGGKFVHAADVSRAVEILLQADASKIMGQAFNCCERYFSELEIAHAAQKIAGTVGPIDGHSKTPKHQIETGKLRSLGMEFGGAALFHETLSQLVAAVP